jgi:hypothetical protein
MEAADSSETSINFYETTRPYVQGDSSYIVTKSNPVYIAAGKSTNIQVLSEETKYLSLSNRVYI